LPGGSQAVAMEYGTIEAPTRSSGRWRQAAALSAGVAAVALVAVASVAPSAMSEKPTEVLSESSALTMAKAYFGNDKKAAAKQRVAGLAARTQKLSSGSAAASMAALEQALGPAPVQKAAAAPKPEVVAAAKPAAPAVKPVQKAAVVKPAVTVHHAKQGAAPLAKLNHGKMFMGEMFSDVEAKPETTTAKVTKPAGDDKVIKMMAVKKDAQSLAQFSAEKKDKEVPAVIRKADGNILSNPFVDKAVAGSKAGNTLWSN